MFLLKQDSGSIEITPEDAEWEGMLPRGGEILQSDNSDEWFDGPGASAD